MLKIKLFPVGKRNQPRYRVVVAPARSKRGGKYIDNLGYYDPLKDPAIIKIDKNKYNQWLKKGAKPTDTIRHLANKV